MTDTTPAVEPSTLKTESWPVEALREHEDNPRRGDVDAIARSIERYGQVRPVLIRSDGLIVAGAHTWKAIRLLERERVEVVVNDTMTEAEAEAYMLADNRLADLGHYDTDALGRSLSRAQEAFGADLERMTGYGPDDLADLIKAAGGEDVRGKLLELADVTSGEPRHVVAHGEVYGLGARQHLLIVADLFLDWAIWQPILARVTSIESHVAFIPYPSPHLPFSDIAEGRTLVMVCPDVYLGGKLLDAWEAINGAETILRVDA